MSHYTDKAVIYHQRSESGIADIDAWNLCHHLERLADEIVTALHYQAKLEADIPYTMLPLYLTAQEQSKTVGHLLDTEGFLTDNTSYSTDDTLRLESARGYLLQSKMSIFHTCVLPYLPFTGGYEIPSAERGEKLMNQVDYAHAGSFYVKSALAGIQKIQTDGKGFFMDTEEETHVVRQKIADELTQFEIAPREWSPLTLFNKYFWNLWD